jgi:predicted component of type VI protein secretion system
MSVFLEPADGKGLKIPIDKAIVFIGRHSDCDVVITRSRMISRKHCAIVQVNNALMIRDLGSTNGIRINGQKIRKEDRFSVGDRVTIADLEYVVTSVRTPEPERRRNRDHPQDERAAGTIPLVVASPDSRNPYSQEIPVVIPEEAEPFADDLEEEDTSDSIPIVSERQFEADDSSKHPVPQPQRHAAGSDAQVPVSD